MFLEHRSKRIHMQAVILQRIQIPAKGALGLERHQFTAQKSLLAIVRQVVVQTFLCNLIQVRVQVVHIAVIVQQLDGSLGPHLRHARHIVARIAHERKVVADFLRRQAILFKHLFRSKINAVGALRQVEKVNLVAYNLRHILVFAQDDHVIKTRFNGCRSGTRHHVVRLVTRFREQRNATCFKTFTQ